MIQPITAHDGQAAWDAHRAVVALCGDITARFLELGAVLLRVRDERLYLALGHETFESYAGDPELGLSYTQVHRLMRVSALTVPGATDGTPLLTAADAQQIGLAKADLIRPVLTSARTREEREDIVSKAASLSVSDLRRELLAARGADADAPWRDAQAFAVRRVRGLLARVEDAADSEVAALLWDEVASVAMGEVAGLRETPRAAAPGGAG